MNSIYLLNMIKRGESSGGKWSNTGMEYIKYTGDIPITEDIAKDKSFNVYIHIPCIPTAISQGIYSLFDYSQSGDYWFCSWCAARRFSDFIKLLRAS